MWGIATALFFRQHIPQMLHERTGCVDAVDSVVLNVMGKIAMQVCAEITQLQHVTQNCDATPGFCGLQICKQGNGGCNRCRVGVVAFVEQQEFATRVLQFDLPAPTLRRLGLRKCQCGTGEIGTNEFCSSQNRKAVQRHVFARHAEFVDDFFAHDACGDAAAVWTESNGVHAHVCFFVAAKTGDGGDAMGFRDLRKTFEIR